jgi:hypothetical protein
LTDEQRVRIAEENLERQQAWDDEERRSGPKLHHSHIAR